MSLPTKNGFFLIDEIFILLFRSISKKKELSEIKINFLYEINKCLIFFILLLNFFSDESLRILYIFYEKMISPFFSLIIIK